ncbi:MAG: hypothetical protein HOP08_12790 [Cyclobacteriaceae bacterium]|nr:hypothetical protein [Cyclobacteriaceae bacterium]
MKPETRALVFNILSLLCGIWFALTSWFWAYIANVFISFPVGILGFIFWVIGRNIGPPTKLNKASIIVHILGVASAVISFLIFFVVKS